jgi:hypothetical protein
VHCCADVAIVEILLASPRHPIFAPQPININPIQSFGLDWIGADVLVCYANNFPGELF